MPNKRRNYFIKKKFQLSFLSGFVLIFLLGAILMAALFLRVSNSTLTTGYANSMLRVERTSDFFFISFMAITLISVIVTAFAGIIVFIFLSHRIAGPLYRFERTLREIEAGDLTKRINLRKNDQLTEMRESLNILVASLDQKMARMKNAVSELKAALSKADDPEALAKIQKAIELLKSEVNHFKVTANPEG